MNKFIASSVVLVLVLSVFGVEWFRWREVQEKSRQVDQKARDLVELSSLVTRLSAELRRARAVGASIARHCRSGAFPGKAPSPQGGPPAPTKQVAIQEEVVAEKEEVEFSEPPLLSMPSLDMRIMVEPPDKEWEQSLSAVVGSALQKFDAAEVLSARCSVNICRVEFMTGTQEGSVEQVAETLGNLPEITGERLIRIDDSTTPAFATAYFGRSPSTTLAR